MVAVAWAPVADLAAPAAAPDAAEVPVDLPASAPVVAPAELAGPDAARAAAAIADRGASGATGRIAATGPIAPRW